MTASAPLPSENITIATMRRHVAAMLHDAGIGDADLDARLIVGHALGLDHAMLAARADVVVSHERTAAIMALAQRRLAREPVARLLGTAEFWSLPLKLNADTLVPRPDTEIVVVAALAWLEAEGLRDKPFRFADLGTGSGALLLALLKECPNATGLATDLSIPALACARDNARDLKLDGRAGFVACRYGAALAGGFDLIVSNPPYIARTVIDTLDAEVKCFDPHLALDGGPDGLDAYRAIAADMGRLLRPGGALIAEIGHDQAHTAAEVFAAAGRADSTIRADLAGLPRVITVPRAD